MKISVFAAYKRSEICSRCGNFLTDYELKYGKGILFSMLCGNCYNEALK
jgi:formylmethanofuran dehydrogenase subunit E